MSNKSNKLVAKAHRLNTFYVTNDSVWDYAFERVGDSVDLEFSIKNPQPQDIYVRLFECCSETSFTQCNRWIRSQMRDSNNIKGFKKSGSYHTISPRETLESIRRIYGLEEASQISDHYRNKWLREDRSSSSDLKVGDMIYIPQLRTTDAAIPLGDQLDVREIDEPVENGKRYRAQWSIQETGYNPLDYNLWIAELDIDLFAFPDAKDPASEVTPLVFRPQFVVFLKTGQILGLSPPPLSLVRQATLETETEREGKVGQVLLIEGTIRSLQKKTSGPEPFSESEEPILFF